MWRPCNERRLSRRAVRRQPRETPSARQPACAGAPGRRCSGHRSIPGATAFHGGDSGPDFCTKHALSDQWPRAGGYRGPRLLCWAMFNDTEIGVVIGDSRSSIRLSRLADANEVGYPTLIEVQAGPFRGAIKDDTV